METKTKVFKIDKGDYDWKVWTKPNDFLAKHMMTKRQREFSPIKTRRKIQVIVTIIEGE